MASQTRGHNRTKRRAQQESAASSLFEPSVLFRPHILSTYARSRSSATMPITAEYTWAESQTTIQLQVPLKGQATSKVDVFGEEISIHYWIVEAGVFAVEPVTA